MYRYIDTTGNIFVLQEEDDPRLLYEPLKQKARPSAHQAESSERREIALDDAAYMALVAAFAAAIDNKVFHRELCNNCTGMIVTVENGQQRRYILGDNCSERRSLEDALHHCLAG